jgi:tRNA(Ile)-lysidine synthase
MKDDLTHHTVVSEAFHGVLDACVETGAPLCVAYSGGMDSTVLLHVAALQKVHPVRAVYVNHGLLPEAGEWATHCSLICQQLDVPFTALDVVIDAKNQQGLEAAARMARYAALRASLGADEILLTAHHQQDQMETFLLQMLRGAGVRGLSAMPVRNDRDGVIHIRPLLNLTADTLRAYAETAGLAWIEDPSNTELKFDRNFLRHEVLPVIGQRWPVAARSIARSARLNAEAAKLLDGLAEEDLDGLVAGHRLEMGALQELPVSRRKNAVRFLLRRLELAVPSETQLNQALRCLFDARGDSQPEAAWPGVRIRRYRNALWFYAENDDPLAQGSVIAEAYRWDSQTSLDMGPVRGMLEFSNSRGDGIAKRCISGPLEVRFRTGGERLRPAAKARTRNLKNLLQESCILPWMRGHIPLIYSGEQLLAVGDLWVDAACAAGPAESGHQVQWTGHAPIC